jgi:hypothetical protein
MSRIIFIGAILLWADYFTSALVDDSYCINYHNSPYNIPFTDRFFIRGIVPIPVVNETITHGAVNCTLGDIVLQGKYINLGKYDVRYKVLYIRIKVHRYHSIIFSIVFSSSQQ